MFVGDLEQLKHRARPRLRQLVPLAILPVVLLAALSIWHWGFLVPLALWFVASIIALASTAKGGTLSKIVATLAGPVTTARTEVDVIVTEFGAAELRGQSLAERTRRLVAIAHPDLREELARAGVGIRERGL